MLDILRGASLITAMLMMLVVMVAMLIMAWRELKDLWRDRW